MFIPLGLGPWRGLGWKQQQESQWGKEPGGGSGGRPCAGKGVSGRSDGECHSALHRLQ